MEASSSAPRALRAEPSQASTSGKGKAVDKDRMGDSDRNKPAPHRKTYKEKFNTLRERFEQVTATRAQYERELAVANDKIKKLENECNLLLDAVDIAAPSQPTIIHFLTRDPVPDHFNLKTGVALPPPLQAPLEQQDATHPPLHTPTNGTTNGHENGH